jgi:hypothetical protein
MHDKELTEDGEVYSPNFPKRNYTKMENCQHKNFTLFFKCKCSLTLGDNQLNEVIEILLKEQERRASLKEVVITL